MLQDLNLLRVFDALMREGKVVKAAARLGLSPPAVSNALARLRSAQGMLPTPHAQALALTLGPALQALQQALASPRSFEPTVTERRFRVAMTDIGEIVFLPRLMQVLQAEAPQVAIHTVRNAAAATRDEMARGGVDLAVGWLPDLDAGFHQRRLFEQRYVCLMAAGHPLAARALGAPVWRGRLNSALRREIAFGPSPGVNFLPEFHVPAQFNCSIPAMAQSRLASCGRTRCQTSLKAVGAAPFSSMTWPSKRTLTI